MKNLTFKELLRFEARLIALCYTVLFVISEAKPSKALTELIEDVFECWLDPEALTYYAMTWVVVVIVSIAIEVIKGAIESIEIRRFNRKNRR